MPEISDAALPWVLLFGCLLGGAAGGALGAYLDHFVRLGARWLSGRLSSLDALAAPYGCDDCFAGFGEHHRYVGCPGNIRQHQQHLDRTTTGSQLSGGQS